MRFTVMFVTAVCVRIRMCTETFVPVVRHIEHLELSRISKSLSVWTFKGTLILVP